MSQENQFIGPIVDGCVNTVIREFKKKENRTKISNYIIKPLLNEILVKCYPYAFVFLLTQIIIIILLVFFLTKKRNI